jgi:hypothetical protein
VAKKRNSGTKRGGGLISGVEGDDAVEVSAVGGQPKQPKPSIGKTGVHLRYHTRQEYEKLSKAQRAELYEWREANEGKQPPHKKHKTAFGKKQVASLVKKNVKWELNQLTKQAKQPKDEDGEAWIMSIVNKTIDQRQAAVSSATAVAAAPPETPPLPPASTLNSILKRAKRG